MSTALILLTKTRTLNIVSTDLKPSLWWRKLQNMFWARNNVVNILVSNNSIIWFFWNRLWTAKIKRHNNLQAGFPPQHRRSKLGWKQKLAKGSSWERVRCSGQVCALLIEPPTPTVIYSRKGRVGSHRDSDTQTRATVPWAAFNDHTTALANFETP